MRRCPHPGPPRHLYHRLPDNFVRALRTAHARRTSVRNHVVVRLARHLAGATSRPKDLHQLVRHGEIHDLPTLLAQTHDPLYEINISPAKLTGRVASSTHVRQDRHAEELLPISCSLEHLLDVGMRHDDDVRLSWPRLRRTLDSEHRIDIDLAFKVKPS